MSTTRITEKLSKLVRSQLPEFIQSDYGTFVLFLEYYYEYLEQDQHAQELIQNARSYADIDQTASSFIAYFLKQYGSKIPNNILVNKPLLIKRLNDLYESKGSELSYKLLFQILFDTTVTSRKPYDDVLRASAGTWEQLDSIRVRLVSGSANNILNRTLVLERSGIPYYATISRVKDLSTGLYELFLDSTVLPDYQLDETVFVSDGTSVIFTGTVDPTITSYEILRAGLGFRTGQVFTVNLEGAVGTVLQITKVGTSGEIQRLKFINYGYDFPADTISIDLRNDLTVASRSLYARTKTNSISEYIQILKPQTILDANRYFDTDYVETPFNINQSYMGELLEEIYTNPGTTGSSTFSSTVDDPNVAVIQFSMGAVGTYPGHYTTNTGFISEPEVRLQDDKLYQPFAYQLQTDIDITTFYDIVKTLVHPAGTNLFNNRIIDTVANIKPSVSLVSSSNVFNEAYSVFNVNDLETFELQKVVDDSVTNATLNVWTLYKPLVDNTTGADLQTYRLSRTVSDSTSVAEQPYKSSRLVKLDTQSLSDSLTTSVYTTINNNDSVINVVDTTSISQLISVQDSTGQLSDSYSIRPGKNVSDTTTPGDSVTLLKNQSVSDLQTINEQLVKANYLTINNVDSTVTFTESAYTTVTNYAELGYFAEVYAGESTQLF